MSFKATVSATSGQSHGKCRSGRDLTSHTETEGWNRDTEGSRAEAIRPQKVREGKIVRGASS